MKERPILFSDPMVRAILEGKKTQTRRISKMSVCGGRMIEVPADDDAAWVQKVARNPYGNLGDLLWVREAWAARFEYDQCTPKEIHQGTPIWYKADEAGGKFQAQGGFGKWRSSVFMPRWASRITLEITGVRVERLQQISDADALAEGCSTADMRNGDSLASVYARLWESIHGPGSWDANPWVWVVEFRKLTTTTTAEP